MCLVEPEEEANNVDNEDDGPCLEQLMSKTTATTKDKDEDMATIAATMAMMTRTTTEKFHTILAIAIVELDNGDCPYAARAAAVCRHDEQHQRSARRDPWRTAKLHR